MDDCAGDRHRHRVGARIVVGAALGLRAPAAVLAAGLVPFLVGVGHADLAESQILSRSAGRAGLREAASNVGERLRIQPAGDAIVVVREAELVGTVGRVVPVPCLDHVEVEADVDGARRDVAEIERDLLIGEAEAAVGGIAEIPLRAAGRLDYADGTAGARPRDRRHEHVALQVGCRVKPERTDGRRVGLRAGEEVCAPDRQCSERAAGARPAAVEVGCQCPRLACRDRERAKRRGVRAGDGLLNCGQVFGRSPEHGLGRAGRRRNRLQRLHAEGLVARRKRVGLAVELGRDARGRGRHARLEVDRRHRPVAGRRERGGDIVEPPGPRAQKVRHREVEAQAAPRVDNRQRQRILRVGEARVAEPGGGPR